MEGLFVTILVFLGVIAISAVLFVFWLAWEILRLTCVLVWRIFSGGRGASQTIQAKPVDVIVCPNPRCRGDNPSAARFCRRCGSGMPQAQHVLARRAAAVW